MRDAPTEGYIYGIRQEKSKYLKIGKSKYDPHKRIPGLQTGNPSKLYVEFSFRTYNMHVAEAYAHAALVNLRGSGEWFNVPVKFRKHVYNEVRLACGRAHSDLGDVDIELEATMIIDQSKEERKKFNSKYNIFMRDLRWLRRVARGYWREFNKGLFPWSNGWNG